jgi:tRNA dimethylallyltransferase
MIMDKPPILTIIGPTAIGKTGLAIELAKIFNGEIVGIDSRQIYKELKIGTAQPTDKERQAVPHHLIGVRNLDMIISAGEYSKLVHKKIGEIEQRNNLPIICGGSGLYFRAMKDGIFPGSVSAHEIREQLIKDYEDNGKEQLFERLKLIDPEYAKIVHPNNKKRLVRALEIFEATGLSPSVHFDNQKRKFDSKRNYFIVLLKMKIDDLAKRITNRTDKMLASGLIEETKKLKKYSPNSSMQPFDSIGYKQALAYLAETINLDEMVAEINLRTRQYAKRQIAWFKRETVDLSLEILPGSNLQELVKIVENAYISCLN